mgnify:FL=1|jgi:hypothetical protein
MEQKNLKKWEMVFGDHAILVTNWWDWNMTGSADLYIDGQLLDQSTEMLPDTKKPMLKHDGFSESIQSIEVFVAGAFSVKISVLVNGESIYSDRLNIVDKFLLARKNYQ